MPDAEIDITLALVEELLTEQHPDLAVLELVEVASGWDNVVYRLGDDLAVRIPRRQAGADLVVHEQRWLPEIATWLPVLVPVPERVGAPSELFPWRWSIVPWIPGTTYAPEHVGDPDRFGTQLGEALGALHRPAPADAPNNPHRGGPLADRNEMTLTRLEAVDLPGADAIGSAWEECMAAPAYNGDPLWVHGDLHPLNMVVTNGELGALLDFGDLTAGDPATDLMVAWNVLDAEQRPAFRAAAESESRPIDDAMWQRARGWAITHGLAVVAGTEKDTELYKLGERAIVEAVADQSL